VPTKPARDLQPQRRYHGGSARVEVFAPSSTPPVYLIYRWSVASDPQPNRRRVAGKVWRERFASPGAPSGLRIATPLMVARRETAIRRRNGWLLHWIPADLGAAPRAVWYHVYANTGANDPINYMTPVATVNAK
jgi:hypothetical protein